MMRLVMGLSTLVIAAVALLWLAMRPVEPPPRPVAATSEPTPPPALDPPAPAPPPEAPPPAAADPDEVPEPSPDEPPPAPDEPPRFRLVAPRATPVPRPVQAIPTPRPVPVDPPPARVAVQNAVNSAKPLVADCYTQALAHSPELGGTLKVSFTVVPDAEGAGRIRDAEVLDGGLRQPFLEMCVLEALGTAEYPTPEGAEGELKVTYPFVLKPGD